MKAIGGSTAARPSKRLLACVLAASALAAVAAPTHAQRRVVDLQLIESTGETPRSVAKQNDAGEIKMRSMRPELSAMGAQERAAFVDSAQSLLRRAVASYALQEKAPLEAEVFDIENPFLGRVLTKTTGRPAASFEHYFMAMQYYPRVVVNEVPMPFCFILFNGSKAGSLSPSLFPSKDDWQAYLVMHEFAHCALAHQRQLGRAHDMNSKQEEAFADMFAMAYAMALGNETRGAEAILKLQDYVKGGDEDHFEPVSRQEFFDRWVTTRPQPHDVFDLFRITLAMHQSVGTK